MIYLNRMLQSKVDGKGIINSSCTCCGNIVVQMQAGTIAGTCSCGTNRCVKCGKCESHGHCAQLADQTKESCKFTGKGIGV